MKTEKTYQAKPGETARDWFIVDLDGVVLGRAATQIATMLRGKHKPVYTPHADTGDFIVAINASKVKLTGNKESAKTYYWHSEFPGGLKSMNAAEMREKKVKGEFLQPSDKGYPLGDMFGHGEDQGVVTDFSAMWNQ